jgi:4-hydroxy-tetrahydrodipicolinate synthase
LTAPPSTFVVGITPFAADESLDEGALRAHLRRLGVAGIGVYLGGSGSGEAYTLDAHEARRVLEIGVEELRGRVPVRAMGVEPRSAREMIEYTRLAADVGVDALQVYSLDVGHGNRPRPDELRRYLSDVLDAVTLPVVLSSHFSVGYALPPDLVAELVEQHDGIIGINCSHDDLTALAALLDAVGGRVDVHVGGPMHALSCLALGGQGFLSSEGNLVPRMCASVIDAFAEDDFAASQAAYARLLRLHAGLRRLGGIAAVKCALELLGLPGGTVRPPRLPLDADRRAAVAALLDELMVRAVEDLDT